MRLDVPYVSQLGNGATLPNDCGQASLLMMLRFYGKVAERVTVDMLSRDTYSYTTATQLASLASRYDMPLAWDREPIGIDMRAMLTAGHPVILLVNYADLGFPPHLASGVDQGYHWLLVIGLDDAGYTVHDPLWLSSDRAGFGGADLRITPAQLSTAYRGYRVYAKGARPAPAKVAKVEEPKEKPDVLEEEQKERASQKPRKPRRDKETKDE